MLTTAGFWLLARGSLSRRASLEGSLSAPTIWQLASPRVSNPREQGGSCNVFHDLASESHTITSAVFCGPHRPVWEDTLDTSREDLWGVGTT